MSMRGAAPLKNSELSLMIRKFSKISEQGGVAQYYYESGQLKKESSRGGHTDWM